MLICDLYQYSSLQGVQAEETSSRSFMQSLIRGKVSPRNSGVLAHCAATQRETIETI